MMSRGQCAQPAFDYNQRKVLSYRSLPLEASQSLSFVSEAVKLKRRAATKK